MKSVRHSRLLHLAGLMLSVLVWLANNANPPTGRTGAPFDGHCNDCHDGNNSGGFDGDVTVDGLPASIDANTTYPLTITVTPTAGSPTKGGFQLVFVDGNNANAGDLTAGNAQSGTEFFSGREYLEHRGGKTFNGGPISWTFNWKSPVTANGNTIKLYMIGNFTNGNNNSSGDFPKAFSQTLLFNGPPPLTAVISSSTNVLCNGGNTGSATVEASGGIAPYTYHWSNNQSSQTAVNLSAGTYSVTVTGSSGSGTATASVTITQPPALALTASVSGQLTCAQNSVTATATASGGTPGYEYFWSGGQTGSTATFTETGTYNVTATDANGCSKVTSVSVTQNIATPTAVAAPGGTLTCAILQTNLSGNGSSQGPSFSYLWTTVGGHIISGHTTLSPVVGACGTYTLTVTNNVNGCTASASTTVNCQIDPPNISVGNTGPLTCTVQNVTLNGSSTTQGVTYLWTGPNGFTSTLQNPTTNIPGTYQLRVTNPANSCTSTATTDVEQNIVPPTDTARVAGPLTCVVNEVQISMTTNIQNATFAWTGPNGFTSTQRLDTITVPGDYIGIVTNPANGCKSRDTATVVQNTAPPGATTSVSGPITCTNSTVQLNGGPSGNNTYTWTGPGNFSSNQQNPGTGTPGVYTLVVKSNENGCTSSSTVTVIQNTTPPVAAIAPPGNLNCNNTTMLLDGTGSSQGANFSYAWTTADGTIVSGGNSLTPIVGTAGTYQLAVTNIDNGCTTTATTTVVQTPPVAASISSSTNVSCNGGANGAATVAGSGGNGNYSYLWSNGATTATITGLSAGVYLVSVTDIENCSASTSVTITQPDVLSANASATGETALGANNGTAQAAPSGGTPAYSYHWSNGATTAQITGLAPGSYTVSVEDANGCTAVQTVTVNAFGCSLSSSISSTNVSCNGANNGSASVTITGGSDPISYHWSNGATTQTVTNLGPGAYTVSVTDANNCPAVLNATIVEPQALSPNATATNETSTDANDGTATATPTGGTGTYSYAWSNGGQTATISNLAPGTYTVIVTDANNCTATQSVIVNAFSCALAANTTSANVLCFGGSDGQATVVVNGGQLPYGYLWSNNATTATITGLVAGIYTVTATDAAGCSATQTATVSQPTSLNVEITNIVNVSCPNLHTGAAEVNVSGGVPPYQISGNLTNLGVGTHSVVVTDNNGCSKTVSFQIQSTDNIPPVLNCPANIYICGADFVSYPIPTATDNCGVIGNPVLISGQTSGSVFNDGTTTQVYQATDGTGNTSTCSFSVVVFPIPDILFNGSADDHNGLGVGFIAITAVGGGGGYTYAWNRNGQFFSTDEDLSGLNAGSYTLTVTDQNGCTSALAPIVINNTVGTGEPGQTGAVRLWPNPTNGMFELEIIDLDVSLAVILNAQGRLVKNLPAENLRNTIDVNDLSTGIYFLKLCTSKGHVITLPFVKSD